MLSKPHFIVNKQKKSILLIIIVKPDFFFQIKIQVGKIVFLFFRIYNQFHLVLFFVLNACCFVQNNYTLHFCIAIFIFIQKCYISSIPCFFIYVCMCILQLGKQSILQFAKQKKTTTITSHQLRDQIL